jgi:hypothetical protein
LCLAARTKDGTQVRKVSVARGNVALADHGRTVRKDQDSSGVVTWEEYEFAPPLSGERTFRLHLHDAPLTIQCQPDPDATVGGFPPLRERVDLECDVRDGKAGVVLAPAVALRAWRLGAPTGYWSPAVDLLAPLSEFAPHFVVDVDDDLRGVLRFGDGEYGRRMNDVDRIEAWYRVGSGRSGNIGADSIAHIIEPYPFPVGWPTIESVRNPLPARDGVDPETIEEVRRYAPAAFRSRQLRAVTERDYRDLALTIGGVAGAVASFRWTGSWYTVFIGIDAADPVNVITDARGVAHLEPAFKDQVREALTRYRLAGYDIEIRAARFIPVDITVEVCVKPGYFRGDVARAVALALGAGADPAGRRGLFDPDNFTFGQSVHLSRVYARVENVEGVESARISAFHPHGRDPSGELENGSIPIGPWEIARLDNDRNNMENGTLTITAAGGS